MRFSFIVFLRALATIMITNSHMGEIYPFSALATGGALGNSLFFIVSGFCLYKPKEKFSKWISKRYLRLYVPLILFAFFNLYKTSHVVLTFFSSFVFPQNYWFICALLCLYPVYYLFVTKKFDKISFVLQTLFLVIVYSIIYVFLDKDIYTVNIVGICGIRFSYIFSFFLMLYGAYVRQNYEKVKFTIRNKRGLLVVFSILLLVAYYGFLLLMRYWRFFRQWQFIETLLCVMLTIIVFFMFISFEEIFSSFPNSIIKRIVSFLDSHTLEIYITQFYVINVVREMELFFPINFCLVITGIFICSYILKGLSARLNKTVEKKISNMFW